MNTLMADGFEKAFLGTADIPQIKITVAVYDGDKCVEILQEEHGMDLEEAVTYFDFNVKDSFMGELTPIFVEKNDAMRCLEFEGNGVGGD